jgi:hypothetical protein
MFRRGIALLILAAVMGSDTPSEQEKRSTLVVAEDLLPDTSKAEPLHWPTAQDVSRLESVKRKPMKEVLQTLGHPSVVKREADGTEVWDYPWRCSCCVWFKGGVCIGVYYDGGY